MNVNQTKTGHKRKKFSKILFVIISLVLVVLFSFGAYVKTNLQPISEIEELKFATIPSGATLNEISSILESEGLIKNSKIFSMYAQHKNKTDLKAGKYQLSGHMNPDEILSILAEGKVFIETIKVTIPEGYNVEQIAALLEKKNILSKEEFLKAVTDGEYNNVWFVNNIPEKKEVKYKLEGFLFPKTYMIREDATGEDIVAMLLKQTENEFSKEWLQELKKSNLSFYDAITLASIVEREAVADNERSEIAEVYLNRLEIGMKLQADATIQYVFDEQKERLLYSDLEIDSKYNTYKYKGLPPGPIANPGLEAIKAVVFPDEHDYLYYVTKKDGTSEHYFSKTYREHLSNIEKSKRN